MSLPRVDEGHGCILAGLAALVNAETAGMVAANMQRAAQGASMAFHEESFCSESVRVLHATLVDLGVLPREEERQP